MTDIFHESDVEALREALVGRSVVRVEKLEPGETERVEWHTVEGRIYLDDGTVLSVGGNDGGCTCGAGDYELTRLNDLPINGITDVQVEVDESKLDGPYHEGPLTYRVFVLAQDDRIELATFDGDDGNGYYGTGFWFTVLRNES